MNTSRRIRTVLYDDQRVATSELELLHTPALQRLYELHQLGLTDRVFIDASHSRLHHVIGVVQQIDNIMLAIEKNLQTRKGRGLEYSVGKDQVKLTAGDLAQLVRRRRGAARLMALLHDLPHAPYGHTLEDELELVDQKHDEPDRQADAFYRLVIQFLAWACRDAGIPLDIGGDSQYLLTLTQFLDRPDIVQPPTSEAFIDSTIALGVRLAGPQEFGPADAGHEHTGDQSRPISAEAFRQLIKDLAFAIRGLLHLDLAHKSPEKLKAKHVPAAVYPVDRLLGGILGRVGCALTADESFIPQRDIFVLDAIGNTICADLLDYAKRDSVFAGLKLDYDADRIVENMTLASAWCDIQKLPSSDGKPSADNPFAGNNIRTAISLFSHKLRIDVPGELLNLLQVRFYVYQRMLFHPTKCIAGAMLGSAIQLIGWKRLPAHLRFTGDSVFLHQIAESARLVRDLIDSGIPHDRRFDATLVAELSGKIKSIPASGILNTAVGLLEARLPTLSDLIRRLQIECRLRRRDPVRADAMELVVGFLTEESAKRDEKKQPLTYDAVSAEQFANRCRRSEGVDPAVAEVAARFCTELLPTAGRVRDELAAGLHLMDRLGSRRFHKAVFRLLPSVFIPTIGVRGAAEIAKVFLRPTTRMVAERAIEDRAGLPLGSVAIHCPIADGPKKIADILLFLEEDDPNQGPVSLRDIGKINEKIFGEHGRAVVALENMYESMWRLVVSVAPPHHQDWAGIDAAIGEVLMEILSGGLLIAGRVANDPTMIQELQRTAERRVEEDSTYVRILYPDGSESRFDLATQQFMDGVRTELESDIQFAPILRLPGRVAAKSERAEDVPDSPRSAIELFRRRWREGPPQGISLGFDQAASPPSGSVQEQLPANGGDRLIPRRPPGRRGKGAGSQSQQEFTSFEKDEGVDDSQ